MRKDELLYLHQLLAVVRSDLSARDAIDADGVETPVSPMAAHAAKADHERAVSTLVTAIADRLPAESQCGDGPPRATS